MDYRLELKKFEDKYKNLWGGVNLKNINAYDFEEVISLFFSIYFNIPVHTTRKSQDHGIDAYVKQNNECIILFQMKKYDKNNKVGEPVVRDLFGVMAAYALQQHGKSPQGIIITTGEFSTAAIRWSHAKNIKLISGNSLVKLFHKKGFTNFYLDFNENHEKITPSKPKIKSDQPRQISVSIMGHDHHPEWESYRARYNAAIDARDAKQKKYIRKLKEKWSYQQNQHAIQRSLELRRQQSIRRKQVLQQQQEKARQGKIKALEKEIREELENVLQNEYEKRNLLLAQQKVALVFNKIAEKKKIEVDEIQSLQTSLTQIPVDIDETIDDKLSVPLEYRKKVYSIVWGITGVVILICIIGDILSK